MDAMARKPFTNERIAFALRQSESGTSVEQIRRKMQVSQPTCHRWKKQLVGIGMADFRRLTQLAHASAWPPI